MRIQPRLKNVAGLMAILVFLPFAWVVLVTPPVTKKPKESVLRLVHEDMSQEEQMQQKMAELQDRLQYAQLLQQGRNSAIHTLQQQVNVLIDAHKNTNISTVNISSVTAPVEPTERSLGNLLENTTRELLANLSMSNTEVQPIDMFYYLPHLLGKPEGLNPAFKISRGRTGVSVVMGIPTIGRQTGGYLVQTISSLITNLDETEKRDCLIVVFIAEMNNSAYVRSTADSIKTMFPIAIATGLLEVISPSLSYYPNLENLKQTHGDSKERIKWRTKQNLDYAFLMLYCRSRGRYYVQLEDDVITKPGYLTTMKSFVQNQKTTDWLLLEFSQLGFIGKLFKTYNLPWVVEFFLMFFKDKPIDWLLDNIFYVKYCSPEHDMKHCARMTAEYRRRYKPSLFQHIGVQSSLKGKVQKLKDKDFRLKMGRTVNYINPNAEVSTTLEVYKRYSFDRAYMGEAFFWATTPKKGDVIKMKFLPPVTIDKYSFRSGAPEHPGDKFYNTTVEVLPVDHINKKGGVLDNKSHVHDFPMTEDSYLVIGGFIGTSGVAEGTIDPKLGPISAIRLSVQTASESWVILNEIRIIPVIEKKT